MPLYIVCCVYIEYIHCCCMYVNTYVYELIDIHIPAYEFTGI